MNTEQFLELCNKEYLEEIINEVKTNLNFNLTSFINAFQYACEKGYLKVAKCLLEIKPDIHISIDKIHAFCITCRNGYLKTAKLLLDINPNINISISNEYPFRYACRNGYLKVAKWLLEIKSDINISINNEYAFRYACKNGHLKVAKWLLKIKLDINISIDDEYAFRYACKNGHLKVAKWLSSIYPDKYIILNVTKYKINYSIIDFNITGIKIVNDFEKCNICFENNNDVITMCNHRYCYSCILSWFETENTTCPLCRINLKDKFFLKLVLE